MSAGRTPALDAKTDGAVAAFTLMDILLPPDSFPAPEGAMSTNSKNALASTPLSVRNGTIGESA